MRGEDNDDDGPVLDGLNKFRDSFRDSTEGHRRHADKVAGVLDKAKRGKSTVKKSTCSRLLYAFALLDVVLVWPVWLKLIVLKYDVPLALYPLYNENVTIRLDAPTLLRKTSTSDAFFADAGNATTSDDDECSLCKGSTEDVTFNVGASVSNFKHPKEVTAPSYIQLLASFDEDKHQPPENFYVVSQTGVLTGLPVGDSNHQVCHSTVQDDDAERRSLGGTGAESTTAPTPSPAPTLAVHTPMPSDGSHFSHCCLGNPGAVYLVACVVQGYPTQELWDQVKKPPFDDYCIAVDAICGSACGFSTAEPRYCEFDSQGRGTLDLHYLLKSDDDDTDPYINDMETRSRSLWVKMYHFFFLGFMTITALSMWISFLPGIGHDKGDPPPSIQEVQTFFNEPKYFKQSKPLVCVSFSISASEPRMMLIRNMVGKLMAWVHNHKFTLHLPELHPNQSKAVETPSTAKTPFDKLSFYDLFQDEGHRPGCYALWDAVTDVVNGCDLQFVEKLALEMRDMTADAKVLRCNQHDLLDIKPPKDWTPDMVYEFMFRRLHGEGEVTEALNTHELDGERLLSFSDQGLKELFKDLGVTSDGEQSMDKFMGAVEEMRSRQDNKGKAQAKEVSDGAELHYKYEDELFNSKLERLAYKCHVKPEHIRKLKVAWACYDLLNQLGHPDFWDGGDEAVVEDEGGAAGQSGGAEDVERLSFTKLALIEASPGNPGTRWGGKEPYKILLEWNKRWQRNKAKKDNPNLDPFSHGLVPDSLPKELRMKWWQLYSAKGGTRQYAKWFDFERCKVIKFKFHDESKSKFVHPSGLGLADDDDASVASSNVDFNTFGGGPEVGVNDASGSSDGSHDGYEEKQQEPLSSEFKLHTLYTARAKPTEEDGAETCRGIVPGVYVQLDPFEVKKICAQRETRRDWDRFKIHEYARKCYGRVEEVSYGKIYLVDCSTHMLTEAARLKQRNDEGDDEGCVAIPLECVMPLRGCRGKAGGMNHSLDVLNKYLSSPKFSTMYGNEDGNEFLASRGANGRMLFAVFDCRHMGQQGFWDAVLPHFFKHEDNRNSEEEEAIVINEKNAFVQMPQTFAGLTLVEDFFDMRNEYGFRMANTVRSGVGAITSCGTNACWSFELKGVREGQEDKDVINFRFNEETMIEDTASSHDVIMEGNKGVYHFERLVLGARKGAADYLAAVFRWSQGAVQLFCTAYFKCSDTPQICKAENPRLECLKIYWPWLVLLVYVFPIVYTVAYLQALDLNVQKPVDMYGGEFCNGLFETSCARTDFALMSLIFNSTYMAYIADMVIMVGLVFCIPRFGAYVIMLENTTYFFNSTSAFFWIFLPLYMCCTGSVPLQYDAAVLTVGGLWIEFHTWVILILIKGWAPLDEGKAPPEVSLLRAQQMYFIAAPLHLYALFTGSISGFNVRFCNRDASFWSSFQNTTALIIAKFWVLTLLLVLIGAIIFAIVNFFLLGFKFELLIGILASCLLLTLLFEPAVAMFFHKWWTDRKRKRHATSCWVRFTSAIFGKHMVLTPKHMYVFLWLTLFVISLNTDITGVFSGASSIIWIPRTVRQQGQHFLTSSLIFHTAIILLVILIAAGYVKYAHPYWKARWRTGQRIRKERTAVRCCPV